MGDRLILGGDLGPGGQLSCIVCVSEPRTPAEAGTAASALAASHVQAGDREKALEIAREVDCQHRQDYAALVLSVVHGFLGEEGEAITILERLFEERLPALVYLNGRTYAPLRGSPRFQDLTGRIGLPQPLRQV